MRGKFTFEKMREIIEDFIASADDIRTVYADSSYVYNQEATNMYQALKRCAKKLGTNVYVRKYINTVEIYKVRKSKIA